MDPTLSQINAQTIQYAGVRYTPAVENDAPNLEILASVQLIDALSLNQSYRVRMKDLAKKIEESWDKYSKVLGDGFRNRKQTPLELARLIRILSEEDPGASIQTTRNIQRVLKFCRRRVGAIQTELYEKERETEARSEAHRSLSTEQSHVRKIQNALYEAAEFVNSPAFDCVLKNRTLILGEWGTGKTHFLCDITKIRQEAGLPTLTVLAHRLSKNTDPIEAICELFPSPTSPDQLLTELGRSAKQHGGRGLIIIDGINEANREVWRKSVAQISNQIAQYDHVGLVLSCRTPFDNQIFSKQSHGQYVNFIHPGFDEIEIDAQSEFFRHYEVPTPSVPLLADEFSRPLFLKILCKTLQSFADQTKRKKIRDIASGHKSMTTIFEDFIRHIGRGVETDFGIQQRTCWWILKGKKTVGSNEIVGIAPSMAERQTDWLPRTEVIGIVGKHTNLSLSAQSDLLDRMILDGLLAEDMIWEDGDWQDVIRMPYQRFSDHLISRHLLDRYLRTDTPETIRRSFYRNRPLGRIFEIDDHGHSYRRPGIASALMLEFPERIKRVVPTDERELIFYLPKSRRKVRPSVDVFLDGLIWRDVDSFSEETHHLVSFLLRHGDDLTVRKVLDTLVCLASRSAHEDTSARLVKYLDALSITERDLLWSEFVRKSYASDTVHRILRWVEEYQNIGRDQSSASALIVLLEWFLTTTDRATRDRATRALVWLGERFPAILFKQTIQSLGRNDPYISERMLAASYGVLMRNWWGASRTLSDHGSEFARSLFDLMFARRGKHRTKHVLAREYALGAIQLCQKMSPRCLASRDADLLNAPFSTYRGKIPSPKKIRDEECAGADAAIMMDFGNYTIGRLLEGRANYDYDHQGYKNVRRQIEWRINNLGYQDELFEIADRQISNDSFSMGRSDTPSKTDRYGKKYSWIAFYEVAGLIQDRTHKGLVFDRERISDIDIDPSFPDHRNNWLPELKPLFPSQSDFVHWIGSGVKPNYRHLLEVPNIDDRNGPWVLLDGFIEEDAENDERQIFTFLRGVLVAENERDKLVRSFRGIEYPGNHAIPHLGEDYYTFAGEVAWSGRFANHLYDPSGPNWARFVEKSFSETRSKKVRKRYGDLEPFEMLQFIKPTIRFVGSGDHQETEEEPPTIDPNQIVEVKQYFSTPGIEIEIPAWSNAWESYHSVTSQGGGFEYPAPALCDFLELNSIRGGSDLVDRNGKVGSIFRSVQNSNTHARGHLLFLREDLLRRYLKSTNQVLVWLVWGERQLHYSAMEAHRGELQPFWNSHKHIHRSTRSFK